jgi:hypothetical protein
MKEGAAGGAPGEWEGCKGALLGEARPGAVCACAAVSLVVAAVRAVREREEREEREKKRK